MAPITQVLPITLSTELDFDQNAANAFGCSLASHYIPVSYTHLTLPTTPYV